MKLRQREQNKCAEAIKMVNICICTDLSLETHHGGIDRIIKFAINISKNGANVFLVDRSRKKTISALLLDEDKYYRVENGILRKHVYPFYIRFLFPGLIKLLLEILNKGLSVFSRTHASEVTLFYAIDPYLMAKLFFVCKKESVDLIQCEFPTTIFPSFVVKKILGISLIYDAHNVESERLRSMANISRFYITLTAWMEIKGANVSDLVFVVSEEDKEQLISSNIPAEKIEIIPNSVETDKFSPIIDGSKIRNNYKLNDKLVFIFHGALGYPPNKEAVTILSNSILPAILKKYPFSYLLLVGKDPPKALNPNILATGFVKNIPEYIAAADIAIVPLLRGGGTKIKMLEYMACGKAVVSTWKAVEGLNLEDGKDVLLSKYPDSRFVDLVFKLIEDRDLMNKIGANARKTVELCYNWERNSKKAVALYGNLV
jgi:glycosyltransferase involved in cell wall biosynthesis